jgi:polar amino acid transport system substrate-binding protein
VKATGDRVLENQLATWPRIFDMAGTPDILIPLLTRTPDREAKFHWIGKLADDRNCFVTRAGKPTVSTLEEAKKLKVVGVNAGGAAEKTLKEAGLTNVETVPQNSLNIKKLTLGRIDAWYTSAIIASYSIKKEGLNPQDFVCSGDVKKSSYYVAATLSTPAPAVEALKKAYADLERKGTIQQIVSKYY